MSERVTDSSDNVKSRAAVADIVRRRYRSRRRRTARQQDRLGVRIMRGTTDAMTL